MAQFPGQEKDFDEARPPVKGCSAMRGPAWCSKRAYASSKIYTLDEGPPANAAYERRFFVEDDPGWRLRFVALYTLPLLLMAWGWCVYLAELGVFIDLERNLHILGKESMFNVPVPMVVFLAVALLLDAAPLWFVARDIVYASRDGVPVVDVDARPSMAACVISGPTDYEEIELKDFKYMRWVTVEDLRQLAALAVVGCWPFASLTLALHLSRLPFATARGVLPFFGTLTIIKAFVGGDVLIRAKWWFEWVFSRNLDDKDELGMYVKERRNLASSLLAMAFSFLVGLVFFLAIDIKAEWKTALFLSLLTLSSCYWGCLCGVGSGLPIEPRIFLTSLQEPGILLRYHRHANFNYPGVGPRICRHPGRHICVDMHSRDRLWILSVDDNQGLYEMLKGTDQTENTEF